MYQNVWVAINRDTEVEDLKRVHSIGASLEDVICDLQYRTGHPQAFPNARLVLRQPDVWECDLWRNGETIVKYWIKQMRVRTAS